MIRLRLDIPIKADPAAVFAALTNWPAQGEWMLGTRVWVPEGASGRGVGGQIHAFTGVWRIGFLDTMTITVWDEPKQVDVLHTGRVVRGTGTMVVKAGISDADGVPTSVFVWGEDLELPLGWLGRAGWVLVRPLFVAGVRRSLQRFAALVEAGQLHATAA